MLDGILSTFIKYFFRFFEPYRPMLTFQDPAKSRLIRKVLLIIKGRGAEIFSKFRSPLPVSLESVRVPPCFLIGNLNTVAAMRCYTVKRTVAPDQNRLKTVKFDRFC
jgi:hypothetical protein